MIAKMKKYSFISHSQDFKNFLDRLQDAGVVHLTQTVCNIEGEEKKILNWLELCTQAIKHIEKYQEEKHYVTHQIDDSRKATYILKEFQKDITEFERIDELIRQKDKEYQEFLPWGNFDPELLNKLEAEGVKLQFFICEINNFEDEWKELYDLEIINQDKRYIYFAIANRSEDKIILPATEVRMLPASLNDQLEDINELKLYRAKLNKLFKEMIPYLPTLRQEKIRLTNALAYDRASQCCNNEIEDQVRIVVGFVPEEREPDLVKMLDEEQVIYIAEEPSEDDNIPILLKNNRFSKLFEPITKIFALPKYTELDLTPFFAPFFMLFVGFCMGDAGYGLLIVLAGFLLKRKMKGSYKSIVTLAQYFGLAGILFGALTGTFFGIELVNVPALASVKHFFVDQNNMMILAIALGVVQILYAMGINVVNIARQQGFKYAVGKLGWLCLLITALVAFGLPMVGVELGFVTYILYAILGLSLIAIFFYNSPGKNIGLQFGLGLWDTYNMATGLLGDVLSYVRLFALGLTGGVLGLVFNSLAFEMSPDVPVIGALVSIIILLIGHSLNFCLTMLSAIVHPLRLTFVEFYKNAGFEGGGLEYEPFKKI